MKSFLAKYAFSTAVGLFFFKLMSPSYGNIYLNFIVLDKARKAEKTSLI